MKKDNRAVVNQLFRRIFRNSNFFQTHVHLGTLAFEKNYNHKNFLEKFDLRQRHNFELDDFIAEEQEVVPGTKIDPKSKLVNFAKIKVAAIDPKIQREISGALRRIEQNLERLKKSVQL